MSEHEPQITVIGPDTQIKGEMTFERTARILGRFEGKITSGGELQVGATAECVASLDATTIIVDGHVEGNVAASDRIQLNSTARVNGDVVAEKLIVAEGASFNGRCCVGPEAVAELQTRNAAAASPDARAQQPRENGTTQSRPVERPIPEVKPAGTNAAAFDWVGKAGNGEANEVSNGTNGWGPRTTAADGAA
ncbi:MAG: polymer-forming cytoskeletal protein [Planctomycetota bacterium]|nr:polymer-forming cytoskeletal protein [Planctomycetota bacterium]